MSAAVTSITRVLIVVPIAKAERHRPETISPHSGRCSDGRVRCRAELGRVVNALGWSTVLIYLLLALGFGYFYAQPKET